MRSLEIIAEILDFIFDIIIICVLLVLVSFACKHLPKIIEDGQGALQISIRAR